MALALVGSAFRPEGLPLTLHVLFSHSPTAPPPSTSPSHTLAHRDKHTGQGNGYGFVVFEEDEAAERAVQTLDGRLLFNQAMRVNWAYQSQNREELKNHFQIFVGDLGNTVTDSVRTSQPTPQPS